MKHKLCSIATALLLLMIFVFPAQAATDNTIICADIKDVIAGIVDEQIGNVDSGEQTSTPDAYLDNVTDAAGLLTDEQWQELEDMARNISEQYDCGVYIVTVEDYCDYTDGNIFSAAKYIYEAYYLGMGSDKDGILLLLSMQERDYCLMSYGDFGRYAFNDEGRPLMTELFLEDFGNDEWYDGFTNYLSWSADYLEQAVNGHPYSDDNRPVSESDRNMGILIRVGIILLVPLVIAGICVFILTSKMSSVAAATSASTYVSGELNLTIDYDHYAYTTETSRLVKDSSSNESSGSASGTSGKF